MPFDKFVIDPTPVLDPLPVRFNTGYAPTDPLFSKQWYLFNPNPSGIDINVTQVWRDYTGEGVHVGIYDNGVATGHHDLDGNYDSALELTYRGSHVDGAPTTPHSGHGTGVAGIIAAENDGVGTVGIAFKAQITSVPFFDLPASLNNDDYRHAAMTYASRFDVVNLSTGTPGFAEADAPLRSGFQHAAANGRYDEHLHDFLGTVLVVANGNSRYVVPVAAAGPSGYVTDYSPTSAALLVTAPSSPISVVGAPIGTPGIATTDRIGEEGAIGRFIDVNHNGIHDLNEDDNRRNDSPENRRVPGDTTGDYNLFGFNSATTAVATGVVALMLDANPELGWRDVREILAYSSRHTGTAIGHPDHAGTHEVAQWQINHADTWNGGGLHFSNDYGFGLLDAHAAVRLAETWTEHDASANERHPSSSYMPAVAIPDGRGSFTHRFTISEGVSVETIELVLDVDHDSPHDLVFQLTSPEGSTRTLLAHRDFATESTQLSLTSNAFWGESGAGTWTLSVIDDRTGGTGTIGAQTLTVYGSAPAAGETYVYTDELGTLPAVSDDAARATLRDSDGGFDTLNASPVTGAVQIDLSGGTPSTIAGRVVTISGIENAIGGDGDDTLTGNASANVLRGMRGNDTIRGGAWNDTIEGGRGNDTLTGGTDADVFVFREMGPTNTDLITDYVAANDTIRLYHSAFSHLPLGILPAGSFVSAYALTEAPAARDANDYILYNSRTGALFYDDDGNGGHAPVQFATLTTHSAMTHAEFVVV